MFFFDRLASSMHSNKTRNLLGRHINESDWAVYSASLKGVLCRVCVAMGLYEAGVHGATRLGTFVLCAATAFKDIREDMRYHENTQYHKCAHSGASQLLASIKDPTHSIVSKMSEQERKQQQQFREALTSICQLIVHLGRTGCAFRGHRDDGPLYDANSEFVSDGNFRESLRLLIRCGDGRLKAHLDNAPKNATYISKTIQEELIRLIGAYLLGKVLQRIKSAGIFTVLADETTDVSTIEQLAMCIRYVHETVSFYLSTSPRENQSTRFYLFCRFLVDWYLILLQGLTRGFRRFRGVNGER